MNPVQDGNQRQILWSEFSRRQVEMLRELRGQLSSRRWEIMLDVDEAKTLVRELKSLAGGREVQLALQRLFEKLDAIHAHLARIPEDLIPPF